MERNQVARLALLDYFDESTINDLDEFSDALWASINESHNREYLLEIHDSDELPFEFIIKLLIKIGFSSDNAVRLMMNMHNHGTIVLAIAEEESLLGLEKYIHAQAKRHRLSLFSRVRRI